MTKYYGFMVCELTGDVDLLNVVEANFKPTTERCGFSFAKWFTDEKTMLKVKAFIEKKIKEKRGI